MFQSLLDAQERGIQITRMPVAYEELLERLPIHHLESDWLLRSFVDELSVSSFYLLLKRLMDIAGGLVGLLVFCITYPWVALAILLESGRPILFTQERSGQGGHTFKILKYRTMFQDAEADGVARWADEGDPRMTRVGSILRKSHLDEFPQFWNVLLGDMSMVGPRPERPELIHNLEKEIPFYRARLLVKPGIGGWAQVNGGKLASIEGSAEKLEFDLYYIKHRSILLDIWIVIRTFGSIVGLQGV
jgi:lipopolysaccharide/colanic/teichoic acid biosynthesis glycosyltransferase